jgi:hypothetical protein
MPQTSLEAASRSNYQLIFDSALEAYKKKTGKDLPKDPLFRRFENCQSPDAVITILRAQIRGPGNRSDKLTTWLDPTVNVINAFSAAIGGVGLVSVTKNEAISPSDIRFEGIPTCGGDFYGYWDPSISEYLHQYPLPGKCDVLMS